MVFLDASIKTCFINFPEAFLGRFSLINFHLDGTLKSANLEETH